MIEQKNLFMAESGQIVSADLNERLAGLRKLNEKFKCLAREKPWAL